MPKKAKAPIGPRPNDGWIYTTEIQVNGRTVLPGTELKISGERGRFRFIRQIDTGKVTWVDVFDTNNMIRSFYPDRIQTVHVKNRTTANLATEYKQKRKSLKNS